VWSTNANAARVMFVWCKSNKLVFVHLASIASLGACEFAGSLAVRVRLYARQRRVQSNTCARHGAYSRTRVQDTARTVEHVCKTRRVQSDTCARD
jgi:hypothetical protein